MKLTQARLKDLLYYDPELGWFMWTAGSRAGRAAGSFNKRLGYVVIGVDGADYYAHRLAFLYVLGAWPPREADHRDRNKTNNRWRNLRPATRKQNKENSPLQKNNTSGRRGVYQAGKKWVAKIKHHRVSVHLGTFDSKQGATEARHKAEKTLFTRMGERA